MPGGSSFSKMATKNCPKCDSANPVACKKCACGHVFFTTRRSANALAVDYNEDVSEPMTPQEPEVPRRRTARVTRERPQFYDALQVENQSKRQKELQRLRKASKSDDVDVSPEDITEKPVPVVSTRKRAESPPATKVAEPPAKKRRGRPPGLTNRRSARAQIMPTNKSADANMKSADFADNNMEDHMDIGNIHDVPAVKALQMNMVLSDINSRISSSSVRAENNLPVEVPVAESPKKDEMKMEIDVDDVKVSPKGLEVAAKVSPTKKEEGIARSKVTSDTKLEETKISPLKKENTTDSSLVKTTPEKRSPKKKEMDASGTKEEGAKEKSDVAEIKKELAETSITKDEENSAPISAEAPDAKTSSDEVPLDTKIDANPVASTEIKEEKIDEQLVPNAKCEDVEINVPIQEVVTNEALTTSGKEETDEAATGATPKEETIEKVAETVKDEIVDNASPNPKETISETNATSAKVDSNDCENIAPKKEEGAEVTSDPKSEVGKMTAETEKKIDDADNVAS